MASIPCRNEDPSCNSPSSLILLITAVGLPEDRWLAVGVTGNIAYSDDLQSGWVTQDLGGDTAAYGHAGYVAVGNNGRIVTSYDGPITTWSEQSSGNSLDLLDVVYAAGLYVAVGVPRDIATDNSVVAVATESGTIEYSSDLSVYDSIVIGTETWQGITYDTVLVR